MSETKKTALTDQQAQALRDLVEMPEGFRAKMIAFAAGMLAADKMQSETTDKSA